MADEDQERLEDYIELENYIEALQAGKKVAPPENLTQEQASIYEMAALFNSATHEDMEPRPAFVEELQARLLEMSDPQQPDAAVPNEYAPSAEISEPVVEKETGPGVRRFFSRRGLLTSGAIAAASLVVGAGIGYETEKEQKTQSAVTPPPANNYPPTTDQHLGIAQGVPTTWHFVAMLDDLSSNTAMRFTSNYIVGYIIRTTTHTDASKSEDNVIALSAACTHKGCLVEWKTSGRQFYCPCHGALFDQQGTQVLTNYPYKLPPLPSLNTKIEQGKVYVEVPL